MNCKLVTHPDSIAVQCLTKMQPAVLWRYPFIGEQRHEDQGRQHEWSRGKFWNNIPSIDLTDFSFICQSWKLKEYGTKLQINQLMFLRESSSLICYSGPFPSWSSEGIVCNQINWLAEGCTVKIQVSVCLFNFSLFVYWCFTIMYI